MLEAAKLVERDGYPVLRAGRGRVCGEVYAIPAQLWPALDAWEEAPRIYQRRCRELINGREVWVYEAS